MRHPFKRLATAAMLVLGVAATPVRAQVVAGQGTAVVNLQMAIYRTKAFQAADAQIRSKNASQGPFQNDPMKLAEIKRLESYAQEQIVSKLEPAITAVMAARKINVVMSRDAVLLATPGGDITPDVTAQLDTMVASVSITPPAGWQPGQRVP